MLSLFSLRLLSPLSSNKALQLFGAVANPPVTPHPNGNWMESGVFRMWHLCVVFTVCDEIHSRAKQMEGVGFQHVFASLLLVFSVIHWPDSVLMVHLCMQLLGKEKIKMSPEQFYWDFGPKRNTVNKQQEKWWLKQWLRNKAEDKCFVICNILWLNGREQIIGASGTHSIPLCCGCGIHNTRMCTALHSDNSALIATAS